MREIWDFLEWRTSMESSSIEWLANFPQICPIHEMHWAKIFLDLLCGSRLWSMRKKSLFGLYSVVTHRSSPPLPHRMWGRKKIVRKSQKNWETFLSSSKKIDLPLKVMNLVFPSSPSLCYLPPQTFALTIIPLNHMKNCVKPQEDFGKKFFTHSLGGEGGRRLRRKTNFELWSSRTLILCGHIINWWSRRRTGERREQETISETNCTIARNRI